MSAPTRACVCAFTALAFICLGSADSDDSMTDPGLQREVTFDISQIMQEPMIPDFTLVQREMDLSDMLDSFKEQGNPGFSPRASRPRPVFPEKYAVQFPLARPSPQNIQSICQYGDRRPRYPSSYFPASGFGVNKRRADAVNTLEAWFTTCCGQNLTEETLLCCATQAWEKSNSHFCEVDASIKAPHFHCCKKNKRDRPQCFESSATNKDYNPTEESPVQPVAPKVSFIFDPSSCPGMTPQSIRNEKSGQTENEPTTSFQVDFPLARPTKSNANSLCGKRELRPHYNIKCLNSLELELVREQAKTHNRMEKRFGLCCLRKKNLVTCLESVWKKEMRKFCSRSISPDLQFPCCNGGAQLDCFQNLATDRDYNRTVAEDVSLDDICKTHKKLRSLYRISIKGTVDQCCHLPQEEKSACITQSVKEVYKTSCAAKRHWHPSFQRCCVSSSEKCFKKALLDGITRINKKGQCPVSL